jgi:hypothetical protein
MFARLIDNRIKELIIFKHIRIFLDLAQLRHSFWHTLAFIICFTVERSIVFFIFWMSSFLSEPFVLSGSCFSATGRVH